MSSILSREEQLTGLRARREKELAQEKEIVEFGISNEIFPPDTEYLFDGPGQFPGWHGRIHEFLKSLASLENHSTITGFSVTDCDVISSSSENGILAAEFELLVQSTEKARKEVVRDFRPVCRLAKLWHGFHVRRRLSGSDWRYHRLQRASATHAMSADVFRCSS